MVNKMNKYVYKSRLGRRFAYEITTALAARGIYHERKT